MSKSTDLDGSWEAQSFFLPLVRGIIHIGASVGQERELYAKHKLKVMWVEPIPKVFDSLCRNIAEFPDQKAVNRLVTDKDDAPYMFHVASNNGESSSILELAQHRDHRPDISYVSHIMMKSTTLDTLLKTVDKAALLYDALVVDTQGSELLVLKGATQNLRRFQFIKLEAWNFEAYVGCARDIEIMDYLSLFGFKLVSGAQIANFDKGRLVFDLLFQRVDP